MTAQILLLCFCIGLFALVEADRTSYKIYDSISGARACFRRLNATHQIGCSSKASGDVGVLHLVDSVESLKWVVETGPHEPYVVILYPDHFNRGNLTALKNSGRVSGVLLLNQTEKIPEIGFSNDKTCPNQGYGLYTKPDDPNTCRRWNPPGSGILYEDWDFPIFFVSNETQGRKVVQCFEDHNVPINGTARDWPLCAAQLKSFMLAAVNAETCIRRSNVISLTPSRVCDPLVDYNIWGSLVARNQTQPYSVTPKESVVVIAARMDATSMFDSISPGADSAATGIAAFFATVKHLMSIKEQLLQSSIENIYFMLFTGESFDYIGSSRIVYDMKRQQFPFSIEDGSPGQPALLKLENIKYFIELSQVALTGNDPYFVHANEGDDLLKQFMKEGLELNLRILPSDQAAIPPSSFQTFLAQRSNLSGAVITNYDQAFRNRFYNSIYDDVNSLNFKSNETQGDSVQVKIAALAAVVARSIARIGNVENESVTSIVPDVQYMSSLLGCMIETANCTLFHELLGHTGIQSQPFPFYVGFMKNTWTVILRNLLVSIQGQNVSLAEDDCDGNQEDQSVDYIMVNGSCYQTTVNVSAAISPAFQLDWQISPEEFKSGLYSTWTESRWGPEINVRIFLKPSATHEILTLGFGTGVLVISFIVVGLLTKKSEIIFPTRPDVIC